MASLLLLLYVVVALSASSVSAERVCYEQNNTCFRVNGSPTPVSSLPHTPSSAACCAHCLSNSACAAWEWNHAHRNGTWNGAASLCILYPSAPEIKTPVHSAQTECTVCTRVAPAAPVYPPAPPGARNVLYILVDDLRTQLEPYGHGWMHTPNIAQLAASKNSVVFKEAHVQSQMCVPTRNSFMSGRRPAVTRVFNDGLGEKSFRAVGAHWTTLPQHLKEHGWFTTGVGKTFHPNSPPQYDPPSWSNISNPNPEYVMPYYYPKPSPCPDTADVWCAISNKSAVFEDELILSEAVRRLKILKLQQQPFFLNVGFHKPHTPYRAPQEFFDKYPQPDQIVTATHPQFPMDQNLTGLSWFSCQAEGKQYPINHSTPYPVNTQQLLRRAYYAAVSFTDSLIGKLLAELDGLGLVESTVVVFHGDHGYQLGERNIWCKETNFNLATHVPLIIRAPHISQQPNASALELVEIVDMFPTITELAGAPPLDITIKSEPPLGGKSLVPILQGNAASHLNVSFSQYARSRCVDHLFDVPKKSGCIDGHWIGFSARTPRLRYTRWVNVSFPRGDPYWDDVRSEEMYDEPFGAEWNDDYDLSELVNLIGDSSRSTDLEMMRRILKEEFATPKV